MKQIKFLLTLALLVVGQGMWADGTADTPPTIEGLRYNNDEGYYEIPDAAALNALAKYVNKGNDCESLTFKVINNITYSKEDNEDFNPIGYGNEAEGNPFKGNFDGQDYTISGIEYSTPNEVSIGLFGYISGALIQNISLDNCSFTGNMDVGAIAGYSYGGHDHKTYGIVNCKVGSSVHVTAQLASVYNEYSEEESVPGTFAGGIIGECDRMPIINCTSAATVKGDYYVGGITGRLISGLNDIDEEIAEEYGMIENCYFLGTIICDNSKGDIISARGLIADLGETTGTEGTETEGLLKITMLNDDSEESIKNEKRLSNYNGLKVNATLSGRTLYKDGSWNTLCLPFDVTINDSPLKGDNVKAKVLNTTLSTLSGTELTLAFDDATTIPAGTPFLIKWDNTSKHLTEDDLVFKDVTINKTSNNATVTDVLTFTGAFSPVPLTANDNTILYLGGDNTLYYPSAEKTIGAFRAYFQLLNGLTAGDPLKQAPIRSFVLNFDDDDQTGIVTVNGTNDLNADDAWYTLDGCRLANKPVLRGIYIHNGKKVIIK